MDMCYDGTLVMPSNCVVMDEEEMTYVDGGFYISNSNLKKAICVIGINPIPSVLAAIGYYKLCALVSSGVAAIFKFLGSFAGVAGALVGAVIGALTAGSIAVTVVDALWERKGIRVGFTWRPTLSVE
jgi:hypothetical protein